MAHEAEDLNPLGTLPGYELDDAQRFSIPRKPIPHGPAGDSAPQSASAKHEYHSLNGSKRSGRSGRPRRKTNGFFFDWWLEILCCLLGLSALMAIIGVIYPYEHKELPQWPYSISINTLVAIFTAILKSSLLLVVAEGLSHLKWAWFSGAVRPLQDLTRYDRASRGPLGAIRLLVSLRGKHLIASTGAFLTLLALAVDPFSQQVIRYYSCSVDSNLQASVDRTNMYSEIGAQISAGVGYLTAGAQNSINAGIFAPGLINVPFECPTGNCTYPRPYHSMAYCGGCTDVTKYLKLSKRTYKPVQNDQNSWIYEYNYTLPSGVYAPYILGNVTTGNQTTFVISPAEELSNTFDVITNPMIQSLEPAALCTGPNRTFGCNSVGAARCTLQPCLRSYTGSVQDGKLKENVTSTFFDFASTSETQTTLNVGCLSDRERKAITNLGYRIESGTEWLACSAQTDYAGHWWAYKDNVLINSSVSENCVYGYRFQEVLSVENFLSSFLYGSMTITGAQDVPVGPNVVQAIQNVMFGDINGLFGGTPSLERLQGVFQNIAESFTAHIRQAGDVNVSQPALGYVSRETTCVGVRWAWLALPAALVGLTIIFFACMIFATGRGDHSDNHDWKSSPLPMMFHGLEKTPEQTYDPKEVRLVQDMEEHARQLYVRLAPTEKGWMFTPVE